MREEKYDYDVIVIGTGPGGRAGALQAAKEGARVLVIERGTCGGHCITKDAIPSKSLREAASYYQDNPNSGVVSMNNLLSRAREVTAKEIKTIENQLWRNRITVLDGCATITDPHTVHVQGADNKTLSAKFLLIATGSKPARPDNVPFEPNVIVDSDGILSLCEVPKNMIVIGGGVVGVEYACLFARLGVRVTLIDRGERLLGRFDASISRALAYYMESELRIKLRLGEEVESIVRNGTQNPVKVVLKSSGSSLGSHMLLYAIGREGVTDSLGLEAAGVDLDPRGRIKVNEHFQSSVENIYAAGDVVSGSFMLAATAMNEGRRAMLHALGLVDRRQRTKVPVPVGVYTIPEIAMVGHTEDELTHAHVPYVTGVSQYRDTARGQLQRDSIGILKLIFHEDSGELLGAHIIGTNATEIIHTAQMVMGLAASVDGGAINFLTEDIAFNYPTLHQCYRDAALDARNQRRVV